MKLQGKVVLVTGAGGGIGRALAVGMAREGADVIVNYHSNEAGAAAVVSEIEKLGRRSVAAKANIGSVAEIKRMFGTIRESFGRVDVLVNNSGVTAFASSFDMDEAEWDRVIDTNLKGTFFCSIEAARLMREQGGGNIVNVSTNIAELGAKYLVAYASSKGGIHAMTKHLAVELAPFGIRVNTFAPGPTLVDRNLKDDPDYERTWGSVTPMNRVAKSEEMIGPALFLASADSSYMTGQIFFVDGGWTAAGRIPLDSMERALARAQSKARSR
jgi:glucose 1-dehydrogenase